ncbi:MAG: hypothetical protein ACT4PL_02310 [Phycisphaerales bacterium]
MPSSFRASILGHAVELRYGDFGGQQLLVDGRLVQDRPFAGLFGRSCFSDLTDPLGKVHAVEFRVVSGGTLGLRSQMVVHADGHHVATVKASKASAAPSRCVHCTYDLRGLSPENGEVRCPECGRHSSASGLDLGVVEPPN